MLFAREDVARLAGVLTATVACGINDGLRSVIMFILPDIPNKKTDGIGLTPAGPNDDQLCVRWAGYWRDS
jgi:hypothetical protein